MNWSDSVATTCNFYKWQSQNNFSIMCPAGAFSGTLLQWWRVALWVSDNFDPSTPVRYTPCMSQQLCTKLHEKSGRKTSLNQMDREKAVNNKTFCTWFCVTTPQSIEELCFTECPVVSMEFLLFHCVCWLNRPLKMQEITFPMVLCTQNMFNAIKKFPAFLNARYK